ncbi:MULTISPECIES: hypothetical protein [Pediococcus]|uniref:Uncharacterized protein n=1 Tax=Pediococcus pentosaceus (strain ATCC 25745 / CCUG 21536 / LMG 10740 / 183-1w) TaxID=278197 RepID=Q03G48_PEDPA|nr:MULTISPECIES: hypothetical protein [Pediococcus]ABJ67824.1 hypothetical protein PEPE_0763 [Pediococcus pentosaceus ATCC 25745]TLQ00389.1 hypothetical protein FEZ50_07540 [Pediococcus pentosaceus]
MNLNSHDERVLANYLLEKLDENNDIFSVISVMSRKMYELRRDRLDVYNAYRKLSREEHNHVVAEILLPF